MLMLVLYGKKRFRIIKKEIVPYECPNCSNRFSTKLTVYSKYFHIFWIPFRAVDKEATAICTECNFERNEMKFGPELIAISKEIKKGLRHPFYAYTGLLLIACLVTAMIYGHISTQNKFSRYAKHPETGDIYTIRNEEGYIFFRILQLKNDSALIQESKYLHTSWSSINEAPKNADSAYQRESYYIRQAELVRLYEEDKVNGIDRK